MTEWREICGYPGYEVSDDGDIRTWRSNGGRGKRRAVPLVLAKGDNGRYDHVILYDADGNRRTTMVHHAVMEAFVGDRPTGMVTCHNNGDTRDNRLSNLRWDTQAGNCSDKKRHGTHQAGDKHPCSILSTASVVKARDLAAGGATIASLARELGVRYDTMWRAVRGKNWRSVP